MAKPILDATKLALRITIDTYDDELQSLIAAGKRDLAIAGVDFVDENDEIVRRAIITYCRVHFGSPPDYDRLKASYDEQKAQLTYATGYTDYGHIGHGKEGGADAHCW